MKKTLRALQIPPSPIRKLAPLARAAEARGVKVYRLNIGQPDVASPKEFFDGLKLHSSKVLCYEDSKGNEALCQEWSKYINATLNLRTSSDDFVITSGASEALIFVFTVCCDPDDEIIVFDPTYANYAAFAAMVAVKLVPIRCNAEDGFALPSRASIEAKIGAKTRAILLCNPNNPTGTVYQRPELETLLAICKERNLYLVVDETYRELVFDGLKPLSIYHVDAADPRILVVDSLSKRFSLCGARLGCLLTKNREVLAAAVNLAQARLAAGTLEQSAAAHMLKTIPADYVLGVRDEYERRQNILCESLQKIPGVRVRSSQGAFYTIARLPVKNAEDFATYMLREFSVNNETTFVAPAAGFYLEAGRGVDEVRISYVLTGAELKTAVKLLGQGIEKYNGG